MSDNIAVPLVDEDPTEDEDALTQAPLLQDREYLDDVYDPEDEEYDPEDMESDDWEN